MVVECETELIISKEVLSTSLPALKQVLMTPHPDIEIVEKLVSVEFLSQKLQISGPGLISLWNHAHHQRILANHVRR